MDFYLLSPELSMAGLALAVILLDLFIKRKGLLAALSVVGLLAPAGFAIALWGERGSSFAGMLVVDEFSLFFKYFFIGVTALVILASVDYVSKFSHLQGEYYALVLLAAGGMMLMAATGELISIYLSLELAGLSLYALVTFLRDPRSSEAGLKYLLLGAVSSAVLLYGMALVFGLTHTTNLAAIGEKVKELIPSGNLLDHWALLLGLVMVVAGFGFKIASIPFHMWVPDVYEGAPTPITAYLSVASKAAGFAVVLRVFFTAFGFADGTVANWGMLFAMLGIFTMTLGNVVALVQTNIKRMLGYSSIAQAGYLMVGLAAASSLGRSGVLFFLTSYAVTNLGAFFAIIAITNKTKSDLIQDFSGMAQRAPLLSFILAFCLISLIGIPPTAGFMAKVYLFNAAVQADMMWLVLVAVVNSVISAYYYLRVVRVMYLGAPASKEAVPSSAAMRLALGVSSLGVLFIGVAPRWFMDLAERAVNLFRP